MVKVTFPAVLQRHVACPSVEVEGRTVRQALDAAFALQPQLRGYLLDETGALRKHVTGFVDGNVIVDRERLSDALRPDSRLDMLQALSGG